MPTDCLILKVEEVDNDRKIVDNEIFILFDKNTETYVIRGMRTETYSFSSKTSDDVLLLISFVIDNNNLLNYKLYNNKNLPWDSDDITYEQIVESLKSNDIEELVGYEHETFSRNTLRKRIKVLRYVYNHY